MSKNKDQVLLENLYANIAQSPVAPETNVTAPEDKSDYDSAEKMLSDALERNGVFADPTSDTYREALDELVAAIQHSPEDAQETADKIAMGLDRPESNEEVDEIDQNEISEVPIQQYESKTILGAYEKIIAEASKKKNNKYAICTAAVGRKNEAKYKRCKEGVEKQNKKK